MAHRLAAEASADIDEVWAYTARESGSIEQADRQVDAMTHRFYLLSTHPHLARPRDDLRPGLRSFAIDPFVIVYRVTPVGDVLIQRVLHGRRNLQQIIRP